MAAEKAKSSSLVVKKPLDSEVKKHISELRKKAAYKKIKDDLMSQLAAKMSNNPVFIDVVNSYMDMWLTKELLREDIEKNGLKIFYDNGGGQCGFKDNPSVERQMKINAQMLKLLSELNIKTKTIEEEKEEEIVDEL